MSHESGLAVTTPQALLSTLRIPNTWNHKHLLGLEHLSASEINLILDYAEILHGEIQQSLKK